MDVMSLLKDFDINEIDLNKPFIDEENDRKLIVYKAKDELEDEPVRPDYIAKYDKHARQRGFIIYSSFECYGQQVSNKSEVFIQRLNSGRWLAWRGTWESSKQRPVSTKIIAIDKSFYTVLFKAYQYVENFKNHYKKRRD